MDPSEVIDNSENSIPAVKAESLEIDNADVNDKNKPRYKNEDQKDRAFDMITRMKKRDLFCDVTLKVEGGSDIRAHKMILASCSPYFFELFTNIDERHQHQIKIQGIHHLALEQLIDYIYSSEISIAEENVRILLEAAIFLRLSDVRDACCEFMKGQLKPSYCLGIRDFADMNKCEELLSFVNGYVEENFWQIVKHDEFLALDPEKISQLISSDYLAVPSEEIIFESIISWVNSNLENRKKFLAQLIEHVRMPLLSQKYLVERVEKEPLVQMNLQCQQFLIKGLKYHLLDDKQKILSQTSRIKSRKPRNQSKVLLIIGGMSNSDEIRSGQCYDFEEEKWCQVSELPPARTGAELAVVKGRIYIVGGRQDNLNFVYDRSTDQWSSCGSIITPRTSFGIAVLDNCIYVVGGYNGTVALNSVEIYNPRENRRFLMPPMLEKRYGLGVGVIGGFIYAVGGCHPDSKKWLASAEFYDPRKRKWQSIADMSIPRYGVGVGVINNILYVVGGSNGKSVFRSVEAYNPASNRWKLVAEMSQCRHSAGVVVFDEMLYVIGGHDGNSDLTSVEIYSPVTNSWTTLSSSMSLARRNFGVVIIEKLRAPPALLLD